MTIRLFACTTKVCCGPCPGEFGIQLRKSTCPDLPCQSWGWWIPNYSGAAYAEIVYTKGCGGSVTESADIQVWHIIPTGGCESSPETGAWIPSVKNYCSGDPECEGVDPDPTELTFFDADDVPIAYYTKNTGGIPGSTTLPHPSCPLTGDLTYSEGTGIGSISSEESAQYTPNWPCEITLESFPICNSTDKIYRLTNGSKEALEDACLSCTVSSVILSDDGINTITLGLSNLGAQLGCTEAENTWNGVLDFVPTKVAITTPFSTPPVYNINSGCVGYRATVNDGSFCGANVAVKLYRSPTLACAGIVDNRKAVVIDNADIPVIPGYFVTSIVIGFINPSTTLTLLVAGGSKYSLYKDVLLEDCDEVTGAKFINFQIPSTGDICTVSVNYYNPSIGTNTVVYYAQGCGCSPNNVKKATITEYQLTKVTTNICGVFNPFAIATTNYAACSDTRYTPYNSSNGLPCSHPCCGVYSPRVCNSISFNHTVNADPLTQLMTFSENIDHTITLPPVAGTTNTGGSARFQLTVSKAACTLSVSITGTITITSNATLTFTLPTGNSDSGYEVIDIAQLLPGTVKLQLGLRASSGSGTISGNCCTGCTGGVSTTSTSITIDTTIRVQSGEGL